MNKLHKIDSKIDFYLQTHNLPPALFKLILGVNFRRKLPRTPVVNSWYILKLFFRNNHI